MRDILTFWMILCAIGDGCTKTIEYGLPEKTHTRTKVYKTMNKQLQDTMFVPRRHKPTHAPKKGIIDVEKGTERKDEIVRKLHGVSTKLIGKPGSSLIISDNTGVAEPKNSRPPSRAKKTKKPAKNKDFEQELAKKIEEDQLKFVEDEKNPLKYVVENGMLYKKSKLEPIAKINLVGLPNAKMMKKVTFEPQIFTKITATPKPTQTFRTNVFRGNINRQIPAIPYPPSFSTSFPIDRDISNGCYKNIYGFTCCDRMLETLMIKSYKKLIRRDANADLQTIGKVLKQDTRNFFNQSFETIIGRGNFEISSRIELSCKVYLDDSQTIIGMAYLLSEDSMEKRKSKLPKRQLPYHELSREDFDIEADLIVAKNGIIMAPSPNIFEDY